MAIVCPVCKSDTTYLSFNKDGYDIYRCKKCKSSFVFPIPQDVERVYNDKYFGNPLENEGFGYTDYDKDKEMMRDFFNTYLTLFESQVPGRNIFDIGAATGYFLNLALSREWQTSGSEISPYAATLAKERGHAVFNAKLPEIKDLGKYDVVTMWDVLEHLPTPMPYIEKVKDMLVSGGILVINTPDAASLFARIMGKFWPMYVPPEHLIYFTSKSLSKLLVEQGFTILTVSKPAKKFSLAYIFKTLHAWQGLSIWKFFSNFFSTRFWRNFKIPLNLRDNVLIIARKNDP